MIKYKLNSILLLILLSTNIYANFEEDNYNNKIEISTHYLLKNNCKKALFYFMKEKEKGYSYPFQNSQIAYCYFKMHKYKKAITYINMFLEQTYNDKKYLDILLNLTNKSKEEVFLSKEIKRMIYLKGLSLNKLKEYQKTINYYNKYIKIFNEKDELFKLYSILADAYVKTTQYIKAIAIYKKAYTLDKLEYYYLKAVIGELYIFIDDYYKALIYFKEYLKNYSNDVYIHAYLMELELVINDKISNKTRNDFLSVIEQTKEGMFLYEFVDLIYKVSKNKKTNINVFLSKYKNKSLDNWRFEILEKWINNKNLDKKKDLLIVLNLIKSNLGFYKGN